MHHSRSLRRSRGTRGEGDIERLEDRLLFAVFNVNSTADILSPPAGVVTLRSAIQAANATAGSNTINLTVPGIYRITRAGTPGEADNAAGEFAVIPPAATPIGATLSILNTSGGAVTVDANHLARAFDLNPQFNPSVAKDFGVFLQGFTIENGSATNASNPDGPNASGGGIRFQGTTSLTLTDMIVTRNDASADGGGVCAENTLSEPWRLTIGNSTISENHAGDSGGGIETDGTGLVSINDASVIAGNSALNSGGGIWLDAIQVGSVLQSAGLNLNDVLVSNNAASSAGNFGGGIGTAGNGAVSIVASTVSGNFSAGAGGGFADQNAQASLAIGQSRFMSNSAAGNGGGVYQNGASTTITSSQFQNNTAAASGGGVFVSGTTLAIERSTFDYNTAAVGGGAAAVQTTGTGTAGSDITDSTFTGNDALNNQAGATGGAVDAHSAFTGSLKLLNDTINGNVANDGGGIFWAGMAGSSVSLGNTIVAGNTADVGADANNPAASFSDLGGNLIGISGAGSGNTGFGAAGTQTGTVANPLDAQLGPLTDNGGPLVGVPADAIVLQTEAPSPSGPAFGKGNVAIAPSTDERGFPNVVNGSVNVGAVSNGGGAIAGSVFNDANNNAALDSGETGVAGIRVYLDANNNGVLDPGEISITTDASGKYSFANLLPGNYVVREVAPSGWTRTTPLAAGPTVTVISGQIAAGPVFGDVPVSSITMNFSYLLLLAQHYGQPGTIADGDLNGDGVVNFSDLLILAQNYGHALPAVASTQAVARSTPAHVARRR